MLLVNGVNLVPLAGLDGGRFFQRVFFSRQRHVEMAFMTLTGLILLVVAVRASLWMLAVFAYLGLATLPLRHRLLREAQALRPALADAVRSPAPTDDQLRVLYGAARDVIGPRVRARPRLVAAVMDQLMETAKPAPGVAASLALTGAWLSAMLVTLFGLALFFGTAPRRFWHGHAIPGAGAVVSMPSRPEPIVPFAMVGWKPVAGLTSGTVHRYSALAWKRGDDANPPSMKDIWASVRSVLAPASADPGVLVEVEGLKGREAEIGLAGRVCKLRVLEGDECLFALSACAATREPEMDRFLDSLRVSAP